MSFTNNFNFSKGVFRDTKPKGSIRDMFDENGEPIVYDRYGNIVREEAPAIVNEVKEEVSGIVEEVDCGLFGTTQIKIPVPTKDFITDKTTDVRAYLAINAMSNVDDCTQVGRNVRYTSLRKYNNNKKEMKEYIGLSDKQINRHINRLLTKNSKELQLVKREYNGEVIDCYQMEYEVGGFVTIPVEIVKKMLIKLGNVPIKLYLTLLWICADKEKGGYKETLVTQKYILEKMGYSTRSTDTIKIATDVLIETKMIRTRDVMSSKTEVKDGKIISSTPKTEKYYTILI